MEASVNTGATDRNYHFISGLPRSGSTLTSALLRQNPRFQAGISSPVAGLFEGIIAQVSAGNEMATQVDRRSGRGSCVACSIVFTPGTRSRS